MTTNRDLDQSDVQRDAQDMLQEEYDDLECPMVPIDIILTIVGDALDIDPLKFIQAHEARITAYPDDSPEWGDLITAHGENTVRVMDDLLGEAVDSSSEMPAIIRALEVLPHL